MRISYPWKFHSNNYDFYFSLKKHITLSKKFERYWNPVFSNNTNEIVITFSELTSTINEKDTINYCEVIFKYKVYYKNKYFYYPIITYVNHEYSLLRGYSLGFEKRMANIRIEGNLLSLFHKDFTLIMKYNYDNVVSSLPLYPFILNPDYTFGNNQSNTQIVTLDTRNYKKICQQDLYVKKRNLKNFLNTIELMECDIFSTIFTSHVDEFEVYGVIPLNT